METSATKTELEPVKEIWNEVFIDRFDPRFQKIQDTIKHDKLQKSDKDEITANLKFNNKILRMKIKFIDDVQSELTFYEKEGVWKSLKCC